MKKEGFTCDTCFSSMHLPCKSVANPYQSRCKSHFSPIHRNGLETDYKRRKSEPIAEVERRMNGGIAKDVIGLSGIGVILLKRKKQKSF